MCAGARCFFLRWGGQRGRETGSTHPFFRTHPPTLSPPLPRSTKAPTHLHTSQLHFMSCHSHVLSEMAQSQYIPSQPTGRSSLAAVARAVLKVPDFLFLLRTALKDRPKGLPTANRQLPSTANRHRPPTTNRHQPPPTASGDQPPTANHCQPPTTTNRHQPPVANCQPPTANRQPPPTMVEHMECPRAFLGKLVPEHVFFSSVKDRPASGILRTEDCIHRTKNASNDV